MNATRTAGIAFNARAVPACRSAVVLALLVHSFVYFSIRWSNLSHLWQTSHLLLSLSLSLYCEYKVHSSLCGFIITREFTCYEYLLTVSCCNIHLLEYIQYGTCTVRVTLILSKIGISSIGKYVSLVRWQIKIFAHISKKIC